MTPWIDYYEELEISRNASEETIKAAYRAMCKKYHPDTYTGDKPFAENKIKRIYAAYDTLGNEDSKKMYDLEYDLRSRYKQGDIPQSKTAKPSENKQTACPAPRKSRTRKFLRVLAAFVLLAGLAYGGLNIYWYATREKVQLITVSPILTGDSTEIKSYHCLADVIRPNSYYYNGNYIIKSIHMPNGKTYEINHEMNKDALIDYIELNGIHVKIFPLSKFGEEAERSADDEKSNLKRADSYEFCASRNSTMCHLTRCRYAKQISDSNIYYFPSREAAAMMGYESTCSVCSKWKASYETQYNSDYAVFDELFKQYYEAS